MIKTRLSRSALESRSEGERLRPPFTLFSPDHLAALVAVGIGSVLAFRVAQGRRARIWNALGGAVFSLLAVGLWLFRLTDGFQADNDLPLSLCDIVFLLCIWAFVAPREIVVILATYWGLAGTLQAMITPDLAYGFPDKEYFTFFIGHSVIVVGVFFLVGKTRYQNLARGRGVLKAFSGLLVYTLCVGGLNAILGWNYGYLCRKPNSSSVLDLLGDWPAYVLAGLAFALILFFLTAGLLKVLWKLSKSDDTR